MEQPLKKHGSCTLGSLDLSMFVKNEYQDGAHFNYGDFKTAIRHSIRGLDNVLDENLPNHPLKKQRKSAKNFRNIGLGVFGLATMFFKMKITYGSKESLELADSIFNFMFRVAVFESNDLAQKKGSFPKYNDSVFESRIIKRHFSEEEIEQLKEYGLRNCSLLSIAPAGSIGTMMNSSTSAEPEFAIKYNRKTHNLDDSYDIYCDEAQYYLDLTGESKLPDYFVCSKDIHWKDRVDVQAVIQRHIDTGISSTVNLPNDTSIEEVEQLYLYAWKQKIKGITIFRDGCKREGILTTGDSTQIISQNQFDYIIPPTKEDIGETIGFNDKKKVACGSLYLTVCKDPESQDIVEMYIDKSKSGVCAAMSQGMSRLVSTCLRSGVSVEYLCDQLIGIKCPACTSARKDGRKVGKSCPDSIGQYILEKYKQGVKVVDFKTKQEPIALINAIPQTESGINCPECGEKLAFVGGCQTCVCGYSKCG